MPMDKYSSLNGRYRQQAGVSWPGQAGCYGLSGSGLLAVLQHDACQRGEGQGDGIGIAVPGHGFRFYLAAVAQVRTAVVTRIGIEPFPVIACRRYPDPVLMARHRREIERDDDEILAIPADVTERGLFGRIAVDPVETL